MDLKWKTKKKLWKEFNKSLLTKTALLLLKGRPKKDLSMARFAESRLQRRKWWKTTRKGRLEKDLLTILGIAVCKQANELKH